MYCIQLVEVHPSVLVCMCIGVLLTYLKLAGFHSNWFCAKL